MKNFIIKLIKAIHVNKKYPNTLKDIQRSLHASKDLPQRQLSIYWGSIGILISILSWLYYTLCWTFSPRPLIYLQEWSFQVQQQQTQTLIWETDMTYVGNLMIPSKNQEN